MSQSQVVDMSKGDHIRILNDYARSTFLGCRIMLTCTPSALEENAKARLLSRVREFKAFNDGNDPHHEHYMAFFDAEGQRWLFKWDYYDLKCEYHSPDPSDPAITCRVLTIGHESDY